MWRYCTQCEQIADPKTYTKGSWVTELLLWLACGVPGLFYSLWRISSRYKGCPACGAPNMIPLDSPRAGGAVIPPAAPWARAAVTSLRDENLSRTLVAALIVVAGIALLIFAFRPSTSSVPATPSATAEITIANHTASLMGETAGDFGALGLALPGVIREAGYTYLETTDHLGLPLYIGTRVGAAHLTRHVVRVSTMELRNNGIRLIIEAENFTRPNRSAAWVHADPDSAECRTLFQAIDAAIHH